MNLKLARTWWQKTLWLVLLCGVILIAANRPLLAWLPHHMVGRQLATDRLESARWWLTVAKRVGGDIPETTFHHSRLARKSGNIELAWQFLNEAETQGLSADRVARERILIRAQSGEIQDAERLLATLLQGSPADSPEVCEAFALGFCRTHASMRMAVGLLNAWVLDYPHDPRPHMLLANLSLEAMDIDNATHELRKVLQIDPRHGPAALALGELTLQQHEPNTALQLFQTAALNKQLRTTSLIWQARCLRTVGRREKAASILQVALDEDANSAMGNIELAYLEIAQREFALAEKRLSEVLDREPYRHEARSPLSMTLRSQGRREEARAHMAIASAANTALVRARHLARDLAMDPENTELRAEIGQIHFQHGDPQEAREWLHSVLMFDPNHQPTRKLLDEFYEKHPARRVGSGVIGM